MIKPDNHTILGAAVLVVAGALVVFGKLSGSDWIAAGATTLVITGTLTGGFIDYHSEGDAFGYMAGGASTATKTVVFSPLASKARPLRVQGVDATSQALNPISYQADTIPGVCWVITHSAAAGTEKFFYDAGE